MSASQTLTIIRGLPGSGKSTLASMLHEHSKYLTVTRWYEADDYFMNDGVYRFDRSLLVKAHNWCRKSVETALSLRSNVIVSNTFTELWEMEPYIELAKKYNAKVHIIECKADFGNIHNVPESVIDRMTKRWQNIPNETLKEWTGG